MGEAGWYARANATPHGSRHNTQEYIQGIGRTPPRFVLPGSEDQGPAAGAVQHAAQAVPLPYMSAIPSTRTFSAPGDLRARAGENSSAASR